MLFLLRHGRFVSFADICEFLEDEVNEGLQLSTVLHGLWREGLVTTRDRFRYEIEAANGHVHQRVEIWVHDTFPFAPDGQKRRPTKEWYLELTLKTSRHIPDPDEFAGVLNALKANDVYKPPPKHSGVIGVYPYPKRV